MINKKVLSQLNKLFSLYPIEAAYLFGSQIKGQPSKLSDVDIAVLFEPNRFASLSLEVSLNLIGDLKKIFKKEKIDLTILNGASPVIKQQAVLSGQRLYCQNRNEILNFEKRALQEYEDTIFLRQVYYQAMRERAKNNQLGEFVQ